MKKTIMICQPFGIGDILFIQKIIHHYANRGFRVVVPILDKLSWMRYSLIPHPDVEYPLISTRGATWKGAFDHGEVFMGLYTGCVYDKDNPIYKTPILYNGGDEETGFIFIGLSESYERIDSRLMPAKYDFVGLDFSDWADHVHLKRRPHVERELYYEVLGLKDDSRYTLVNEHASRGSLSLPVSGNVVRLKEADGFTLFDWFMVIERAAQIVTIDTSLVLLAEILKLRNKPLHIVSRYQPPSFDEVRDILKLDWTYALTPGELTALPIT